jgi:hypothetical protein
MKWLRELSGWDVRRVNRLLREEIARLEAVRDALTEELAQERADRLIKTENAKLRRSEGSKRGWAKRKGLEVAA